MIQHTSTIPPEFFERRRQVGECVSALMARRSKTSEVNGLLGLTAPKNVAEASKDARD
jgi:hypothetical protein